MGAASDSAYGFKDAVEKYYVSSLYENRDIIFNGNYDVLNGVITGSGLPTEGVLVPADGKIPSNGYLEYENSKLKSGCLTIDNYKVTFGDGKVVDTSKGSCIDLYTITFDSNGGTSVTSIRTLGGVSITKPTNPTKDDVKFLGWYSDSELTNKFNFSNGVGEDTTLYAKWGTPSFATDSWTDIKANLEDDRSYYPIGSTKTVSMNLDGTDRNYTFRLINTSPCGDYVGSRTSCGIIIQMITGIYKKMNESETNAGGWYASDVRKFLNPSIENFTNNNSLYSMFSSDLQTIIIPTAPIITGPPYNATTNDVVATDSYQEDKIFLLSAKEVGSDVDWDNKNSSNDVKTLQYYSGNYG